jgi:hypothetical protein
MVNEKLNNQFINCKRRLSCLNSYSKIYIKDLFEPLSSDKLECKIYEYLSCDLSILSYFNLTMEEIEKHRKTRNLNDTFKASTSKIMTLLSRNSFLDELVIYWYKQNGLRIFNDVKLATKSFNLDNNETVFGVVNNLLKFKPIEYETITCVSYIRPYLFNFSNEHYLNYVNNVLSHHKEKHYNNEKNAHKSHENRNSSVFSSLIRSFVMRLIEENLDYIKFENRSKIFLRDEKAECKIELLQEPFKINIEFLSNHMKYFVFLGVIFIFSLYLLIIFVRKKIKTRKSEFIKRDDLKRCDYDDQFIDFLVKDTKNDLIFGSKSFISIRNISDHESNANLSLIVPKYNSFPTENSSDFSFKSLKISNNGQKDTENISVSNLFSEDST